MEYRQQEVSDEKLLKLLRGMMIKLRKCFQPDIFYKDYFVSEKTKKDWGFEDSVGELFARRFWWSLFRMVTVSYNVTIKVDTTKKNVIFIYQSKHFWIRRFLRDFLQKEALLIEEFGFKTFIAREL